MPATPKKSSPLTFRQIVALAKKLSTEEKQKLLAILQQGMPVQDLTAKNKQTLPPIKKYEQHPGLLIVEEDAVKYTTTSNRNEKSVAARIPEWQKQFVRKSIKKYNTNPELLIAEKDAWRMTEKGK
jgi:hypothetical protein